SLNADKELTWQVAEQVASELSSEEWYSTQSIAWGLLAMSEFSAANQSSSGLKFSYQQTGSSDWTSQGSNSTIFRLPLDTPNISVRNDHDQAIRVLVSNRGTPANLHEQAINNGLSIDVNFLTLANDPLDVQQLPQGTDFVAEVTVSGEFDK